MTEKELQQCKERVNKAVEIHRQITNLLMFRVALVDGMTVPLLRQKLTDSVAELRQELEAL